ncbi:MAG: amidohydrolase, partial [Bacteroidales bacterium]|nr:amidohydrolase [Bacteroidales bacterium]
MACSRKEQVDIVVYNGVVYTVDNCFSVAEAFAIRDGKFVEVGSSDEICNKYTAKTMVNAQGKAIFPGFMDGHCHLNSLGEMMVRYTDLVGCKSFDEVLERLKKHSAEHPSEWLLGRGWDQNLWSDKQFPDNKELEKLFPGKKVLLTRIDGHAGLVTNNVLEILNMDGNTKIDGGSIETDSQGIPTGILLDNAYDMAKAIIPPLTNKERSHALITAQKKCFDLGLSGVSDAGLSVAVINLIDSLQSAGDLKLKINAFLNPDAETMDIFLPQGPIAKERLSVRTIKIYADGALGSRGAFLIEPYSDDPENSGLKIESDSFYTNICKKAHDAGYQLSCHCIGDAGVRMMLEHYGKILKGKNDLRWRIEHAQVVHPDDFELFSRYSIIPSIQSTHATSDMDWAADRLGAERVKGAYAQQQLLQQNGWLINGTDAPIESINPLYTFYAAVSRKDLNGNPTEGFQMENALSREDALRSITIWVAKGYFEENRKGSIEAGKEADFVILSNDIMK